MKELSFYELQSLHGGNAYLVFTQAETQFQMQFQMQMEVVPSYPWNSFLSA